MKIGGATRLVGVFGWPVRHTLSPPMHQAAFEALGLDWAYVPFTVPPERLEQALRALPSLGIVGTNVTLPHKERVAGIVDLVEDEARAIGAVNTVTVLEDGRLHGMNTDAVGFLESLREDGGVSPEGRTIALIGTGGAGRACAFALARAGAAKLTLVNRTIEKAARLAADLKSHGASCEIACAGPGSQEERGLLSECSLLVNSTSLGLRPGDPLPVDPHALPDDAVVYDLVYRPLDTPLLKAASMRGLKAIPGLGMLVRQGARSFERWTGLAPDISVMFAALKSELGYD